MGETINIQMDEDMDNLMAMMELNDLDDDCQNSDTDDTSSIVAPSEVSFFSDCEEDNLGVVSIEDGTSVTAVPVTQGQSSSPVQVRTDEPLSMEVHCRNLDQLAENETPHIAICNMEQTFCTTQNRRDEAMSLETHQRRPDPQTENEILSAPVMVTLNSANLCPQPQPIFASRSSQQSSAGFTIVGDNIDKNFRPSYQRQDRQTKSVHYFHSYAAKNRVDISALSDARPPAVLSADVLLPNQVDVDKLLSDFEILTSR